MDKLEFHCRIMLISVIISAVLIGCSSQSLSLFKQSFIDKLGLTNEPIRIVEDNMLKMYVEFLFENFEQHLNEKEDNQIYALKILNKEDLLYTHTLTLAMDERLSEDGIGTVQLVFLSSLSERTDVRKNVDFNICLWDKCTGIRTGSLREQDKFVVLNITQAFIDLFAICQLYNITVDEYNCSLVLYTSSLNLRVEPESLHVVVFTKPVHSCHSDDVNECVQKPLDRRPRQASSGVQAEGCSLHDWTLEFRDIGWDKWIIRPLSYKPDICTGSCHTELAGDKINMSSHAYLRSMFMKEGERMTNYQAVPAPSCVPMMMAPLNILFQTDGTFTVKRMAEMVAKTCGCY